MKTWGKWVRWCRRFDDRGDFCRLCLLVNRAFWMALGRNPTFVSHTKFKR